MKIHIDLEDAVKLRDHSQAIADTWNEILEKNTPPDVRNEKPIYSLNNINSVEADGKNGKYRKATSADNREKKDFEALVEDLEAHDGKLTIDGLFVWKFGKFGNSDEITVGWKPSNR